MALLLMLAAVVGVAVGWLVGTGRLPTQTRRPGPRALARRERSALEVGIADVINLLNNRLAAIAGFADLIRRHALSPSDREVIDQVRIQVRHAAEIVRDMIHLVQPPAGGDESAYLPAVLDAARERQRDGLERLTVALQVDLDPSVAMVSGRRGELVNLFSRLLRFALVRLEDASPPRRITWSARVFGAGLVVTQRDSGPALPPAFEAVRVDYFRPADELFLGHVEIALAQRLAENCHAGLAVAGAGGGGAEVTVTLIPGGLYRASPAPRLAVRHAPGPSSILVADDDAANRRAIGQLLERQGHRVVLAADGLEAQHALEQSDFDVIITDLQMPRVSGQELYEGVLRTTPQLARRFIFVTGDDVRAGSHEFLSESSGITVRKPFALDELLAAVEEASHRA